MEVSLWDVERTFAAGGAESQMNGKRKKELEEGETWRAKNVSLNSQSSRELKVEDILSDTV
jgi:hypothetical protein